MRPRHLSSLTPVLRLPNCSWAATVQVRQSEYSLHIHLVSEERFDVRKGNLGVIVGKEKTNKVLKVGELIVIPPSTPPTFWSGGEDDLHFITAIKPPVIFKPIRKQCLGWHAMARSIHKVCPISGS